MPNPPIAESLELGPVRSASLSSGFSPPPLLLPDVLDLNSRWLPKKHALVSGKRQLTWRQFGDRTAQVANGLVAMGLAPGDHIVLLMGNSIEMAESMFGMLRAGIVAVPLNVAVNDTAVENMIHSSDARAVIASGEHIERIEKLRVRASLPTCNHFVGLNTKLDHWIDYEAIVASASRSKPRADIVPTDECNIIYSSGTTGMPKGIVHSHGCRMAWASDMAISLRYHSGARTLLTLGLYSNISWVAMLSTILAGGTLIIKSKFDTEDCLSTIEREQVTHFAMVPLQFRKLLDHSAFSKQKTASLVSTMSCGSPMPIALKRKIMDLLPGDFVELYGLTEGLITILGPEDMEEKLESVGRPCPGQDICIVGNDDKVLATGSAGEIVGQSRLIMSGYHNNPEENIAATWRTESGERWLRTGDIGRLDEDGFLYLVDRKKDMIISGGQNIYPADIEAIINTLPEVSEIAVIGVPSEKWGETPIAIVVANAGAELDPLEITQWANRKLGKQQRIATTILVDSLPRNPNGKVLKRELRQQYQSLPGVL